MIHATICTPGQRLRRMRGDDSMIDNNPYAAPTAEIRPKRGVIHHDFEFTERGIRCRTGLELPKICFVTGGTDNLVPHRVQLTWMSATSKVMMFGIPLFCLMVPAALFFLNRMDSGRFIQQIQSVKWLPIAWSSTFQLGVFFAIWMSPRGVVTGSIQKSVRRRIRMRLWIAATCGIFGVIIAGLTIMSKTRGDDWMFALLTSSLIGISIVILALGGGWRPFRKSPYDLKCLQLKVVDYQSGKFEIAGFTEQFLAALREHRVKSKEFEI
jgi:hypothetical protein